MQWIFLIVCALLKGVTGTTGLWKHWDYDMSSFRYRDFHYKDTIPISQDPSIYRSTCKMTSLYWDGLQRPSSWTIFPIVILIRWKLDFKCNFIVENHIATKFCTTVVPCAKFHKDHFTQSCMRTTWNFHRIWITTEKSWNALQLHRFMLAGPCVWYGPTPDHCHQKVFCWHNA